MFTYVRKPLPVNSTMEFQDFAKVPTDQIMKHDMHLILQHFCR
jgi:hypothetical protein